MIDRSLDLSLFENDFGVTGTFGTDPSTFELTGMFTTGSQGVVMGGVSVEVEAAKDSFTVKSTDAFGTVTPKMPVTINAAGYIVERIEPVGNGYTVLWLKGSR